LNGTNEVIQSKHDLAQLTFSGKSGHRTKTLKHPYEINTALTRSPVRATFLGRKHDMVGPKIVAMNNGTIDLYRND
jgi:hypothetical protein